MRDKKGVGGDNSQLSLWKLSGVQVCPLFGIRGLSERFQDSDGARDGWMSAVS